MSDIGYYQTMTKDTMSTLPSTCQGSCLANCLTTPCDEWLTCSTVTEACETISCTQDTAATVCPGETVCYSETLVCVSSANCLATPCDEWLTCSTVTEACETISCTQDTAATVCPNETVCDSETLVCVANAEDTGLSTGAIIGIIIGAVVFVALIVAIALFICKKDPVSEAAKFQALETAE